MVASRDVIFNEYWHVFFRAIWHEASQSTASGGVRPASRRGSPTLNGPRHSAMRKASRRSTCPYLPAVILVEAHRSPKRIGGPRQSAHFLSCRSCFKALFAQQGNALRMDSTWMLFVTHYEALEHSHPFFSRCNTGDVMAQHAAGSCVGPAPKRAIRPRVLFAGLRRTRGMCVAGRVQREEFAVVGSGINRTVRGHDRGARRDG